MNTVITYGFDNNNYQIHSCKSFNNIESLPNYNHIIYLDCYNNQLTHLPKLPDNLEYLICCDNQITLLPILPKGLRLLYCGNNCLTKLPKLPNSLHYLSCNNNQLAALPILPDSLKEVICSYNNLKYLPTFMRNSTNKIFEYYDNPVYHYIINECDGNLRIYNIHKIFANKLSVWFLECKYNPLYKYCRDRVNNEYDSLIHCS